MRIAIYGPGRLGRTLAELLPAAGHQVVIWRRGEVRTRDVRCVVRGERQGFTRAACCGWRR